MPNDLLCWLFPSYSAFPGHRSRKKCSTKGPSYSKCSISFTSVTLDSCLLKCSFKDPVRIIAVVPPVSETKDGWPGETSGLLNAEHRVSGGWRACLPKRALNGSTHAALYGPTRDLIKPEHQVQKKMWHQVHPKEDILACSESPPIQHAYCKP